MGVPGMNRGNNPSSVSGPGAYDSPFGLRDNGGGMMMGPNHPIFDPRNGPGSDPTSSNNAPDLRCPPGARFDPIGPSATLPRGNGQDLRPRGSGSEFTGEPDNDNKPFFGSSDVCVFVKRTIKSFT